ncbi:TetR/AcrR family transcriptional regulator [Actinomadura livida]|uniref:AcrR family transcriptional regulator n=1 Tax=Actinomadura livida TaxID=79909 RepID=A0A7W7IHE7_9ACTN|nr:MULTISPECIES: TetR/AcrR family transcriptional regulator [Actinomadura]MBB4777029.1 AcrR family transcriptional regulator [Actinomadura catellatispora]GGU36787.1 putative TetR family transcriptional regulator [Actinomadura livida]
MSVAPTRRADARRNREKILAVAREAFARSDHDISMAEISRRAGVGMATLYRNFASRRELLEALYQDEVDAVCAAAGTAEGETPGAVFTAWLQRFLVFTAGKRPIAAELLTHIDGDNPVFGRNRARVLAAGGGLLAAAQEAGEVRRDLALEQILDMIVAIGGIDGDAAYLDPIVQALLDGLRPPADA